MKLNVCPMCGDELKVITVRVPVYLDHRYFENGEIREMQVLTRYDEFEEVCDCPRCQGAY